MRGSRLAPVLLLLALAACGRINALFGGGGAAAARAHPATVQVRPIVIVLSQKKNGNDCVAKFGNVSQHAFNGDVIAWEFINNCDADQDVEVTLKQGTSNPFISSPPWGIKNLKKDTDDKMTLVIGAPAAAPPGIYNFGIKVGANTYDPVLEIDP